MALHNPAQDKARKILRDRSVRGKTLTRKQRRFFGAVASGKSKEDRKKTVMKLRAIRQK